MKTLRQCISVGVLLAGLLTGASAAEPAAQTYTLNIAAQPIDDALHEFGRQSGLQVFLASEEGKGITTPPVVGTFTAKDALARMLANTGLHFEYLDEHTIAIRAPKQGVTSSVSTAQGVKVAQADGQAPEEARKDEGVKLEEVVVTAQKRSTAESVKDVPMTINAISGDILQKRGITDVKELTFAIPSLSFHSFGAGTGYLNLRGIGGERGNAPTVGLYLDDIPVEASAFLNTTNAGLDVRTYDLERVEVLKGPQGTLFGESSLGGLIRYVTKDPKLDRVEGRVESTFFGTKDGDPSAQLVGAINIPLVNDVLGLRIAGTYEKNGGWIDQLADWNGPVVRHDINDNSLTEVRAKLLYAPEGALRVSALIDVHRNNLGAVNAVNVHPFEKSEFVQGAGVSTDYPTDVYDHFNIYNLTAQYKFGFATLLSSTSRFDSRIRSGNTQGTLSNLGAADQPVRIDLLDELLIRPSDEGAFARVTTQEFRLTSNGAGPAKWLVGGSWKKSRFSSGHAGGNDFVFPTFGFELLNYQAGYSSQSSSKVVAGFTDGSYTFFKRLEIGGGVRVYHENQDGESFDANNVSLGPPASGTFKKTTYRVYAKYRLSDQVNLYANRATGFRSGVTNPPLTVAAGLGFPKATKPEDSIFHEVGMKATFLDHKLGLDLALFQGQYKNQILAGATPPPSLLSYWINAGVVDIKGIEWQVDMALIDRLKVGLSGDVLRSKYTEVGPDPLYNPTIVGDPSDFVPKYDLTLTTDYAFNWSSSVPGLVNVSYSRKGPMQHSNRNTGFLIYIDRSVPTDLLQASLGATVSGFEFTLFARNILDERKPLNPNWAGVWSQERPRSFGVSVAKSFK